MKKKVLYTAGCAILAASTLIGASSTESFASSTSKKINITFFDRYPDQPYASFFDKVVNQYETLHPNVHINMINALNSDYKQKIDVLLASDSPPDIYFSWVGQYEDQFVQDGRALNLTKYYQQNPSWAKQIIPSQVDAFSVGNQKYGVPLYMDSKLFFYNKTIFNKLHMSPPKTWPQLLTDLKTIKQHGYTPIEFGDQGADSWAAGHYLTTLISRMVPTSVVTKDDNPATGQFTNPGYLKALQMMQQLVPYFNSDASGIGHDQARANFLTGKSAIMYMETTEVPLLSPAKFPWGMFNFPAVPGGAGSQTELTGAPEGFMISKTTKYPQQAMNFLEYLTSKSVGEEMVKDTGWASVVKGAVNSSDATAPEIAAAKQIQNAGEMAIWVDTATAPQIFTPFLAGAQQLFAGQATPQQIMQNVQAAATQLRLNN